MVIFLADLMSSPLLTKFAIFGAAAVGAWWLLDVIANGKPRAEQRLEDIREPNTRKSDILRDAKGSNNAMTKMLEKATPALSKPLQPKSDEEIGQTRDKLNQAGFRGPNAVELLISTVLPRSTTVRPL